MSTIPIPPDSRQNRNAETGSRGSCLTRENRSSSAAATSRPSWIRQQADSWKKAERPTMFTVRMLQRPSQHPATRQQGHRPAG